MLEPLDNWIRDRAKVKRATEKAQRTALDEQQRRYIGPSEKDYEGRVKTLIRRYLSQ
jgi:hypothetical protein